MTPIAGVLRINDQLRTRISEVAFRLIATVATSVFAMRAAAAFVAQPWRITILLVLFSEVLTVVLLLLSSTPKNRDWHPLAVMATLWAYSYAVFLSADSGYSLLGQTQASVLSATGLLLTIYAKLSIGRSFGLLPARRDIVSTGPYRFIRHPMYVGYFMTHTGFILSDFSVRNACVLALLYVCQVVRVEREERLLGEDETYLSYRRRVPYRFVYGLI